MRLDRTITLYVSMPLLGLGRQACGRGIPILMYHSIAEGVDDQGLSYYHTVTSPKRFEAHMAVLRDAGYDVVTLSEAVRQLGIGTGGSGVEPTVSADLAKTRLSGSRSRRVAVITFDDGLRDFYSNAFPVLERSGFGATVFLTSGCIDGAFVTGRECLRTEEIRELAKQGIEFGSHTVSHPQLRELSRAEVVHELSASKRIIESITGVEVSMFSYPYRFPEEDREFTRALGALLCQQGYSAGVTTRIGLARPSENRFFLRRLPVNDADDVRLLRAKLEGAYDWLHRGQVVYKRLRRAIGK